jgi:N-dimethylarginine dimethylaminohydrolase
MSKTKSILMCAPEYFDIEYEINPWMHTDNQVDTHLAAIQWHRLYGIYTKQLGWDVQLVKPEKGLPDMVFTANGGLVYKDKVALPRFRAPDRQPETKKFEAWFKDAGYQDIFLPKYDFEGEGDALVWNDIIFAGYPWRSDHASHKELADFFDAKVISLQLADARFYHLDTCLTIVDEQTVALWPKAFTAEALKKIHEAVPHVIEATDDDALAYGLNAMSDTKNIVVPEGAHNLMQAYKEKGMNVFPTAISEYQKSGGGVKCLTLELRA